MNKKESIRAMLDGNVVTDKDGTQWKFSDGEFQVFFNSVKWISGFINNNELHDRWSLYKKPKKKVKVWQYLDSESGELMMNFYTDDGVYLYINQELEECEQPIIPAHWVKTNCYAEVEV